MKKIFAIMMAVGAFICGSFCLSLEPVNAATISCGALADYNGSASDASAVIQDCINRAAANDIVELPAGKYYVGHQIKIDSKPITLRTQGKTASMARCKFNVAGDCAELIVSRDFYDNWGMLYVVSSNSVIDHLVINGNNMERKDLNGGKACELKDTNKGKNLTINCSNCSLTNSISRNNLCGTACGISGDNVKITNNLFAFNGIHDQEMLWSDGITIARQSNNLVITGNEFIDGGTDVELIMGGCRNCIVKNNSFRHTGLFAGGSFAALMLNNSWGIDNTGTEISNNIIDCGTNKRCGFGLLIGGDPWVAGKDMIYGGVVRNNTIVNSQQGITVDEGKDMAIYSNKVVDSGGNYQTSCGERLTYPFVIGRETSSIDTSKDTTGIQYKRVDWDGCLLNYWTQCKINCDFLGNDSQFVEQSIAPTMVAGQAYQASVTMKNIGATSWDRAGRYRLGSQNPRDNNTWGKTRIELAAAESIEPIDENTKKFIFTIKAPAIPGTYDFQWQMVQEGVQWFGEKTPNIRIVVNSGCASKTCASLGNYQCGSWDDGCGNMINCGACATGKICQNGKCLAIVPTCPIGTTLYGPAAAGNIISGYDVPARMAHWTLGSCTIKNVCFFTDKAGFVGYYLRAGATGVNKLTGSVAATGPGWNCADVSIAWTAGELYLGRTTSTANVAYSFVAGNGNSYGDLTRDPSTVDRYYAVCVVPSGCTNECQSGAKQCSGAASYKTCGNYDFDSCLEWSAVTACSSGKTCSNGNCVLNCIPKTCTGLDYNCGMVGDGCGGTLNCGSCGAGYTCTANKCVSNCTPKTCAILDNYQCGSWDDGCGNTINCGTCATGKTCSEGQCVSNCSSHASKKCDGGNLYWYNSCNAKEDLAQNCGADEITSNYRCSGDWTQKETIRKGCVNTACFSQSTWNNDANCSTLNKTCQNGICVSSGGGGSGGGGGGGGGSGGTIEPKQPKQLTRAEILTKIQEIKKLLVQLIMQLIAKLQEQLAMIN